MANLSREIEILHLALLEPIGLVVSEQSNWELQRAKFYQARQTDPAFECLQILRSPTAPDTDFWIMKRGPSDG